MPYELLVELATWFRRLFRHHWTSDLERRGTTLLLLATTIQLE